MKTDELIDLLKCCGEKNCMVCPEIEECVGPAWLMQKAADALEELRNSDKVSISRDALIKKIFPYGMPDNGNYSINAKAVMEAILKAKAVEKNKD